MTTKTLGGFVIWTALCTGIWLLALSAFAWSELIVGAACAAVCAVAAVALQGALGWRWSSRRLPWKPLVTLPVVIVSDAAQVLIRPLRRAPRPSRVRTADLGATGRGPAAATRRAVLTVAITSTPATIVLDVDDREGVATLHSLESVGPRLEKKVGER